MPKIAYLTSSYGRAGDTFIRGEVEQLRKLGFTVETFSIRAPSEREMVSDVILRERRGTEDLLGGGLFRLIVPTLTIAILHPGQFARAFWLAVRIGTPGLRGRLWPMAYLLEACLLARRMQVKGVKHLHNHIGQNSAAVAMLASLLSGIPYSLTIHGPTEFDMPLMLALNEKISRSMFTIAISSFGRSQLMRWSSPDHWHKIHTVRCGFPSEFKSATVTDVPDVQRIACVARFVAEKGHLLLVEAVARLLKQGRKLNLDLIGDGPFRPTIEAAIARYGIERYVTLHGWKDSREIRRLIESSRGFVLPSFAEGLPVSLMEAMAIGRPVIGTDVGATSELIEHRRHGWLIPAGSVEELVLALNELIDMPVETLTEMGREGRQWVLQRHDANQEALKIASLITGSATMAEFA